MHGSGQEQRRLEALKRLGVLDTPPEERFDRLVRFAGYVAGAPIALLTLLDQDRQWFKSRVGLDVCETPRGHSFCDQVVRSGEPVWITDATEDPRYANNPLVTGDPGIRFYGGAPVRLSDGTTIGAVCVIDRTPRAYDRLTVERLSDLAVLAARELERRDAASEQRGSLVEVPEPHYVHALRFQRPSAGGGVAPWEDELGSLYRVRAEDADALAQRSSAESERKVLFEIAALWRMLGRDRKMRAMPR